VQDDMTAEVFWRIFELTGWVEAYLMYRRLNLN